jgi:beta-aspartyl-peptidase (threonine type)
MPISLVVHGGAGDTPADRQEEATRGCYEATLLGWQILQAGGSALDAVEATVCALEDNPAFNAGRGSCLNAEGNIELDAGIMDGRTLTTGAIAGVELIQHPISLARKVLSSPHVLLVGRGAEQFAEENEIERCAFDDLLTERQYRRWKAFLAELGIPEDEPGLIRRELATLAARDDDKHGTVGAVAIDQSGGLAAATSTGGILNKYPGRVGDSPLVGCGFYADEYAAISCTGHGEDFVRLLLARRAAELVAQGYVADEAARAALAFLSEQATGKGGLIIVDHLGRVGFAWNTSSMAHAFITEGMDTPHVGIA